MSDYRVSLRIECHRQCDISLGHQLHILTAVPHPLWVRKTSVSFQTEYNNNKWRWWMRTVANYRRTPADGWLGMRVGGHVELSRRQMHWVNSHKDDITINTGTDIIIKM